MTLAPRSEVFVVLAVAALTACGSRERASAVVGEAPDPSVVSGIVEGRDGPEAGVWVVAESDELPTGFAKIVVTDEDGRFVLPELPDVAFDVWVRGYGLADSEPVTARRGDDLVLVAAYPASPQEEAAVYPANYWYSLMEVPPADEFPGTGAEGNGISPTRQRQAEWIDDLKQGCQLCHQLGNRATREISHLEAIAPTTVEKWKHRTTFGQRGAQMSGVLQGFGERGAAEFAAWSDRIVAGDVPPQPPRPKGEERNVVLTMWDWGDATSYVHDEIATDKRDPAVNAGGLVYGVSMSDDRLLIVDPETSEARDLRVPVRDPETPSYFPTEPGFEPSMTWGDEVVLDGPANVHNPMMDQEGRVWLTSRIRSPFDTPEWCRAGSSNPYAQYLPLAGSGRQASVYDPETGEFTLVDTCYATHHLQFAEDDAHTLYFSGDTRAVGWIRTRKLLEGPAGDLVEQIRDQAPARLALREEEAQGWCPTVIDTNGDGRITKPWNAIGDPIDPSRDTQLGGFAYGIIVNPVDEAVWIARPLGGVPGRIVRLELGDAPPTTCKAEVYEPPFATEAVPVDQWGFAPRGIDVDRNGVIWTALSGSGHMASFDRAECEVLSGPEATGQHCPEGWTLYPTPGPQMKNVETSGSADFHYYNWVDQFNTLGLGENVPIANGTTSDALLALLPESGDWVRLRVPYPLGFYSRGLDGRIDDPDAGWKGRALWANFGTNAPWHIEGGPGATSKIVKFQLRPNALAY